MQVTADSQRRAAALETAFMLFVRFGYRKTSMDEIARAVGLSRQGLYLWFPNKKALFSAMFKHFINKNGLAVDAAFADEAGTIEERIVTIFVAMSGSFIASGVSHAAVDELLETAVSILGLQPEAFEAAFVERLAVVLETVADDCVSAHDIASTLFAVSSGIKYKVASPEEYAQRMRVAALAVCRRRA